MNIGNFAMLAKEKNRRKLEIIDILTIRKMDKYVIVFAHNLDEK